MDTVTVGILFALSAAITLASVYTSRKNRRAKGMSMMPAIFGALTVIAGLLFILQLLGHTAA